ncbi:MAG: heavy metal sensor signal transduction histidine kinase [Bryobacterales bacterium]|nr:heavy metal sensor signal transduction histidine kinase [Bryobacterales bacterium]
MTIPIRIRLTAVYCAVFWLSTALLEAVAYVSLTSAIDAVVDRELRERADGLEEFLNEHVSRVSASKLQTELTSHVALGPQFLEIDYVAGPRIFQSKSLAAVQTLRHAGSSPLIWTAQSAGRPLRILALRRKINGRSYDLYLGADLTIPFEILLRFRLLIFLSAPIVLGCASLAGYWVGKRALEPVSRLTFAAKSISAANLSSRLSEPNSGDELQDLARTLNGMLGRIEDAFREATQFTANASHELRTPLALIRTTAEVALLRVSGNADSYREALYRVLREAEKNTVLLDDMLRLSRADSIARVLALQPVALGPHIEQVCERIAPLAREKNLLLKCDLAPSSFCVPADAGYLRRLWLILLDNAIKYTPAGGTIDVSIRPGAPGFVICEIEDSGIGISDSDLPHIFERFFRADKARSREEGGAGLGLSIARWIVEAHHASIEVESTAGRGSRFRVILPAVARLRPAGALTPSTRLISQ